MYETANGQIMVTQYRVEGDSFRAERPALWPASAHVMRSRWGSFGLHPDGERVAMAPRTDSPSSVHNSVVFLLNFFDELRRLAPVTP
jgi:hypothetical protein